MTSHLHLRIIDNPLVENKTWRTATLNLMIAVLIRDGTCGVESDAIRSLRAASFAMPDIIMCIDDARQAAMQDIVAREMAQP